MKPKVKHSRLIYIVALSVLMVAAWVPEASAAESAPTAEELPLVVGVEAVPALEARLIRMAEENPSAATNAMEFMSKLAKSVLMKGVGYVSDTRRSHHAARQQLLVSHILFKRLSLLKGRMGWSGRCLSRMADALLDTYTEALSQFEVGPIPGQLSGCTSLDEAYDPSPEAWGSEWWRVAQALVGREASTATSLAEFEYTQRGHDTLVDLQLRRYTLDGRDLPRASNFKLGPSFR